MDPLSLFALIAGIVLLGFLGQWLAWSLEIPSIVFLFLGGLIVGPLTGVLQPDQLFGELLFPIVSALIGIILFEAGLTLDFDDIGEVRGTVLQVILLGGTVTFILSGLLAYTMLGLRADVAFLLGGILVVTGPTVVIPMLHQVRPQGDVGSIARWEGIIIDPLGAILAVIVFEFILAEVAGGAKGFTFGLMKFGYALTIGTVVGLLAGYVLVFLFDRYWIPDFLHNFSIITFVLVAQAISNHFVHESGLLAVTVMGMYLANQKQVTIRHIMEFKEDLRVLFISALFIILVARLQPSFIYEITTPELLFLGALILLVRPIAIVLSTIGSRLDWSERAFLSWLAPRGIVAAAVSSLFARELEHLGIAGAGKLDDVTFLVIAGTVVIYGLTLRPLTRLLGLADRAPQGVMILGAHQWARTIALALRDEGVLVRMVDENRDRVLRAREAGIDAQCVNVMTEAELQAVNMQGIGYFLALTSNDEVNTLSVFHALDMGFDRSEIFQLSPREEYEEAREQPDLYQGRFIFDQDTHYDDIQKKVDAGWRIDTIQLDDEDKIERLNEEIPDSVLPLVRLRNESDVMIIPSDDPYELSPDDRLIVFVETDFEI
jgi:NhaP-type Na+/H+ or K+/H+ antiporter